jgi:hypothetical protein
MGRLDCVGLFLVAVAIAALSRATLAQQTSQPKPTELPIPDRLVEG